MIYAPIVIPTCNRIHHLKRCIGSLSRNPWAQYTDLYISIDFPPSPYEYYEKGYKKIKVWLQSGIEGFKNIYIYEQSKNLGPRKNIDYLINTVTQKYDRCIITEDDNEFSENFIEYMDKGLEMFEHSPDIYAICASNETTYENIKYSAYRAQFFQPWGIGIWKNKYKDFLATKEEIILNPTHRRFSQIFKLYLDRIWLFRNYINDIICNTRSLYWKSENELSTIDAIVQLYIYFKNMYCIFPVECKARTWGNDGSGFTMKKDGSIDPELKWPLDSEKQFRYVMLEDHQVTKYIEKQADLEYRRNNHKEIFRLWGKYLIFCILGKNKKRLLKYFPN